MVARRSNVRLKSNWTQLVGLVRRLPHSTRAWLASLLLSFVQRGVRVFTNLHDGTEKEEEKVIMRQGVFRALKRCAVHIIPLCATAVLASINLKGYFIGTQYTGLNSPVAQSFDRLLLQVTAKLYELLIIASLTTIILDVLRRELFFGSEGLPFGLVSSASRFQELSFWGSPDFWFGQAGLLDLQKRFKIVLLLLLCSLIALFAGPSSALLMLPQDFTDWPGGGATFFMIGTDDTLWPNQFLTGPSFCNSSTYNSELQSLENRNCLSSSSLPLLQTLQGWQFGNDYYTVDVTDGLVNRQINIIVPPLGNDTDTWAITAHMASCVYSELLTSMWHSLAIFAAPMAQGLGSYAKYRDRSFLGTTATIQSQVPIVRVNCDVDSSMSSFSEVSQPVARYPIQPEEGPSWENVSFVAPSTLLPFDTYVNSPRIATIWLPTPENETVGVVMDEDGSLSGLSSAFLNIQIPYLNSSTAGVLVTCSIDARWAVGDIDGSNLAWWLGAESYSATVRAGIYTYPGSGYQFPAMSDVPWRMVRLGLDWLSALTPVLDVDNSRYTSLSLTLQSLGINNSTGAVSTWSDIRRVTEATVAATIADGMAHAGYNDNGGDILSPNGILPIADVPSSPSDLNALLSGDLVLPVLYSLAPNATQPSSQHALNTTKLRWDLKISGQGYAANSVAYYLAMVVIFAHTILALCHTAWSLWLRQTSNAWENSSDVLALAINSMPSDELVKTSGGIKNFSNLKKAVRIREMNLIKPTPVEATYNRIHLVVGTQAHGKIIYDQLQSEKDY